MTKITLKYCFQNICRICATVNDYLNEVPESEQNGYLEILKAFGKEIIDYGFQMPNKLCSPCLDKLHVCIDFRIQLENADVYLQETLDRLHAEEGKASTCSGDSDIGDNSELAPAVLYNSSDESDEKPLQELKNENRNLSISLLHTCTRCRTSFHCSEHLTQHEAQHAGSRGDSTCLYCTDKFINSSGIQAHMQAEHRNLKYNCGYCNTKFDYEILLQLHIGIHSSDTPQEMKQNGSNDIDSIMCKSSDSSSDESVQTKRKRVKRKCIKKKIDQKVKPASGVSSPMSTIDLISSHDDDSDKDVDYIFSDSEQTQHKGYSENHRMKEKGTVVQLSEPSVSVRKYKRCRDYCFYCEREVSNFARHLTQHHRLETEVQKILSLPRKTIERARRFTALRKKGNYLRNEGTVFKPMKRSIKTHVESENYLPCCHCLGFYSRKNLWKHRKTCPSRQKCLDNRDEPNERVQSEAQSFLVRHINVDPKLKKSVFPTMRADKISLVAKRDLLICALGSRYLEIHRKTSLYINVTSRKMRELARLLIEITKSQPSIKNLLQALQPQNYNLIVEAAKAISKYDSEKYKYELPPVAMSVGTSLRLCCHISISYDSDKQKFYPALNDAKVKSDLKTMLQLLKSNWRSDVWNPATDDLVNKKVNVTTIIPLASDVKMLNEYLTLKSTEAASRLRTTANEMDYEKLLETVYCRLLLLNRIRPWDLQRLSLNTYQKSDTAERQYEEFDGSVSVTERVLLPRVKLIVIWGKRGGRVPVLVSLDVQKDVELLIEIRDKFVSKHNVYLFGKPGHDTTLSGYEVFEKFANACGAENPKALSSINLRKHLVTLTQLFTITETNKEQLVKLLGYSNPVVLQEKACSPTDELHEIANISKLLFSIEDGKADQYKGMTFDEIKINLEEEIVYEDVIEESCVENDANCDDTRQPEDFAPEIREQDEQASTSRPLALNTRERTRQLVPWTPEQKRLTQLFFKQHLKARKAPKKRECDELIEKYPIVFHNKNWLKIKVFVQNTYTKRQ